MMFTLSLSLRLWFCFVDSHFNEYAGFDAVGYIAGAKALASFAHSDPAFLKDCALSAIGLAEPSVAAKVQAELISLQPLLLSGPTYPLFLLASYWLSFTRFEPLAWWQPVAAHCLLSSATVVFVTMSAARLFQKQAGIVAGSLAAVYPAFIIGCGRACTETFATFFLCGAFYLATVLSDRVRHKTNQSTSFFALCGVLGAAAAVLQLTRSVFVLLSFTFVALLAVLLRGSIRWKTIACFIAGFAMLFLPWLLLQRAVTGQSTLVIDRVSKLNFGLGNSTKVQGWAGFPLNFSPEMDKKIPSQFLGLMQRDPMGTLWLAQDKLPRLFKCPWNDFKNSIGPVDVKLQSLFHQLIVFLSAFGLIFAYTRGQIWQKGDTRKWALICLTCILCAHLSYLPFVTVGRYNLTAMPFLMMLAAVAVLKLASHSVRSRAKGPFLAMALGAWFTLIIGDPASALVHAFGVHNQANTGLLLAIALRALAFAGILGLMWFWISSSCDSRAARNAGRVILLVLAGLSFASLCLPVRAHGRWYENEVALVPGSVLKSKIEVPASVNLGSGAYLMIDAASAANLNNGADVSVNGVRLDGPVVPALALVDDQNHFERRENSLTRVAECIIDSFTIVAGMNNNDLRQWFLLPLPPGLSATGGKLTVELKAPQSGGSPVASHQNRAIIYGAYSSDGKGASIPGIDYYSWDKAFYGVEESGAACDPRVDQSIEEPGKHGLNICLLASSGDDSSRQDVASASRAESVDTQAHDPLNAGTNTVSVSLRNFASIAENFKQDDQWLVRLKGEYKNNGDNPLCPGVELDVVSIDGEKTASVYNAPWAPKVLKPHREWQRFDIAAPLKPSAMPGRICEIRLTARPASKMYDAFTRPPSAEKLRASNVSFRYLSVEVTRLSSLPTARGYRVLRGADD